MRGDKNMITEQEVRDLINNAVQGVDMSRLAPEADFVDFGLDSLDVAGILMAVDEGFKIKIPDEDIERCSSIKGLVAYCNAQTPVIA
jgi:acyl carrier protein